MEWPRELQRQCRRAARLARPSPSEWRSNPQAHRRLAVATTAEAEEEQPKEQFRLSMPAPNQVTRRPPSRSRAGSPESVARHSADRTPFRRESQIDIDSKDVPLAERYRKLRRLRNSTEYSRQKEKAPAEAGALLLEDYGVGTLEKVLSTAPVPLGSRATFLFEITYMIPLRLPVVAVKAARPLASTT